MAAPKKGDLKEAGRHANPARMNELAQLRSEAPQIPKSLTKEISDSATLARSVRRVIVRGDLASVVPSSKEVDELVREGDIWKID